ncbi:MAG: CoA-binding protein [Promethearchaeota archaeon]
MNSNTNEFGNNFNLNPIFEPKSVVVVGVSQKNYFNPGTTIFLKNLFEMNLGTNTFGINPRGGILESQKLYESISQLPITPDVAVIAIPPKPSIQAVKDCIDKGIKGIIIISGGYAEAGKTGKIIQDKIRDLCIDANTPLIGPNCVGIYHPPHIDTIFLPTEKLILPKRGNVSIVSQSGGVMLDQFFLSFYERDIGISTGVSIGNKAVVNEIHLLDYFSNDNETNVIAFYIEGFEKLEGRKFLEFSKKTMKDIVVYQGGKSEYAKSAVKSHTASIASNFLITKSAFKQFGIIQPQTEEEVLNYIKTYSVLARRRPQLNFKKYLEGNVAIITVSGGHGVVCMDLLEKYDLKPVEFTIDEIKSMKMLVNTTIQEIGSFSNPIDLTGAATDDDIVKTMEYLFKIEKIDIIVAIVVPYPPAISIQVGRRISFIARHYNKPLVCFVPYIEKYNLIREALELYNIPVAHTVSELVQMAAAIRDKSRAILRLSSKLT